MTLPPDASPDRQTAVRIGLRSRGYRVLPVDSAKAPTIGSWQVAEATDSEIARWAADPQNTGTGVILGTAVLKGYSARGKSIVEWSCRAGDAIGVDLDMDDPADRRIYDAIVARVASYGVTGPLVTIGRADAGKSCRIKLIFRALEDFPAGAPLAKTVHYVGHLAKMAARARGAEPASRSVEMYAAGRQFAVSGWNAKAGCPIEIRVNGEVVDLLPLRSELAGLTIAMWVDLVAFIDTGCGLGLQHSANERALPASNTGGVEFAPLLLDTETGKVVDGRESAITRACFAAHAKVLDDPRVPLAGLENEHARQSLAAALAWAIIERDVDLERARDGGNGQNGSHWCLEDVEERIGRVDRANAAHHLADRRQREAFAPNSAALALPIEGLVAAIAPDLSPLIDRHHLEAARVAEDALVMAEAARTFADLDARRIADLEAAGLVPDGAVQLAGDPLIFGFCNRNEIGVLYGPSSIGKTSVVASWGFQCAAGFFMDPANQSTSVAGSSGQRGASFTHFDHQAAHVLVCCEGGQVIDPVRRGLEAELTYARNLGFPGPRVTIPVREIPEWWSQFFPSWAREQRPDGSFGWPESAHPSRYLRHYGVPGSPGFIILDAPAAEATFPEALSAGHAFIRKERNAIVRNQAFIDLCTAVAVAASYAIPTPLAAPASEHVAARRPVVLGIDNLLEICMAGEEHDAIASTYHVISRINRLANAGTVLLHHATKSGDAYAGSASIFRYASTFVELMRDPDDSRMRLFHHQKMRLSFPVPHPFSIAQFSAMKRDTPVFMASNAMLNPSFRAALEKTADGGAYYGCFDVFNLDWDSMVVDEVRQIFHDKGKPPKEGRTNLRPRFQPFGPMVSGGARAGAAPPATFGEPPTSPGQWASTPAPVTAGPPPAPPPLAPVHPDFAAPLPATAMPLQGAQDPAVSFAGIASDDAPRRPVAIVATARRPGSLLFSVRVVPATRRAPAPPAPPAPPPAAPAPRVITPDQREEAAARRYARQQVDARIAASLAEAAYLWPCLRSATGISWTMPEPKVKPERTSAPRPAAPKPAPDMSPLEARHAAGLESPIQTALRRGVQERHHVIALAKSIYDKMEFESKSSKRMPVPPPEPTAEDLERVRRMLAEAPVMPPWPKAAPEPVMTWSDAQRRIDDDDDIPF